MKGKKERKELYLSRGGFHYFLRKKKFQQWKVKKWVRGMDSSNDGDDNNDNNDKEHND